MNGKSKALLATFTAAILSVSAPAQAAERSFMAGSFEKLIVEGDIRIKVITGKSPSAKGVGDKRALDSIRIERSDKQVTVRFRPSLSPQNISGEPVLLTLTTHSLRNIVLRGSVKMEADQIKTVASRIELYGASELKLDDVSADRIIAYMAGSGKIMIAQGAVRSGEVLLDGSGSIEAPGLVFNDLKLTQNGAGTSHFRAERKVEISAAGSGSIEIDGKAVCLIREAGAASIKCKATR